MIKLGFYGAAGEVTGSCYIVTTDRGRVMVDMGMHQGEREADEHNRRMPPGDLAKLDAVVLTHAHLDHCGRLPQLANRGYRGPIHCTLPTAGITEIILRDSAHIQSEDFARRLRHGRVRGPQDEPLYNEQDVERTLPLLTTIAYDEVKTIAEGISIQMVDAGHILGAASVQMKVDDGNRDVTIAFSGDVGPVGAPILRDPITPLPADAVLLESTYGDHDHRSLEETLGQFLTILKSAQASGSKVLIPAFAVGRTQDVIYHIGEFVRTKKLSSIKVFLDSPMASSVSALYTKHTDIYDDRAIEILSEQMMPLTYPGLTYTQSVEESKGLNDAKGAMVIIAANGMCTGGRILHHLRYNLPDPNAQVVIVGYQGETSLGRRLINGAPFVSIFGQDVKVRAQVHTLGGFSAHAGQSGLVNWAAAFETTKPRMFLTHGDDGPRSILRQKLKERWRLDAAMPKYGEEVDL
jgi:metallo-beta-lactamase family protein